MNAIGSSFVINHCLSLLSSSSKLLTDMNLNITKQDSSTDELLEGIGLYHHEQNSLTLSLTKCNSAMKPSSPPCYFLAANYTNFHCMTALFPLLTTPASSLFLSYSRHYTDVMNQFNPLSTVCAVYSCGIENDE